MYRMGRFDGILGLAWPTISEHQLPPVFEAMLEARAIPQPYFAFYLGDTAGSDGELLFGGVDTDHFEGQVTWATLIRKMFWEVPVAGMRTGNEIVDIGEHTSAIIDSGTSLIA
eukprot:Polyplicarium_translucidae@DN2933_c0_g1_i1.p3